MMGSSKDWAALLGFDRDTDERTMASRARVLARILGYIQGHFSDPDGARPSDGLVIELSQFLALAEAMEPKGRGVKFKELSEAVMHLHLHWDETDREEAFGAIARKAALFKGAIAFADAWLGSTTVVPGSGQPVGAVPVIDDADVKTRIVRASSF